MPFASSGRSGVRRNIALGITPTASNWDTPPSNLERVTDGDINSTTGVGSTTTSGAGTVGVIFFDFGRNVHVFCILWRRSWSDSADFNIIPYSSVDGSTYRRGGIEITTGWHNSDPGIPMPSRMFSHYGRYLRLYCYANGAGTHNLIIHEFAAYEVEL